MKKIILLLFSFLVFSANAEVLRGGVVEEYIPKGFFGSWGVIAKLQSATDTSKFNYESKDIWMLSGHSNILILQNLESGAYSEIVVKEKSIEGRTLKFERQKTIKTKQGKQIQKETVEFVLSGNNFSGKDIFELEDFDKNNTLQSTNSAIYNIEGVRISGSAGY